MGNRCIINQNNLEGIGCMDVLKRVLELRKRRGWTEYRLAEESGLPQSTISSWYRKRMTPSVASLEKICGGFGITLSQFFSEEGEVVALAEQQHELLDLFDTLSPAQKQALIGFLRTLNGEGSQTPG